MYLLGLQRKYSHQINISIEDDGNLYFYDREPEELMVIINYVNQYTRFFDHPLRFDTGYFEALIDDAYFSDHPYVVIENLTALNDKDTELFFHHLDEALENEL